MESVKISVVKTVIPTYPEPAAEELPMFAENRVHQRTSGNPYPNKVVLAVNRREKVDKEYDVVVLENEYLKIEILPEIGGRIYSALDKTTGYDFFYKQHVIKPALIGALGSWISGGVEFNWPFHHRASGFMPCDYMTETLPDGSAVCRLSEYDPTDGMKGMVSIILRPGEKRFETAVRLYNRTNTPRSFLWWENAAVPVHEKYRIFFPEDVTYVNFHYLKSRMPYPTAGETVYNGIPMKEPRDISWHKNTVNATSYFACASDYDFFGGYDYAKECGVVHIGDHNISPGKKMFTWGYGDLSKCWENALTDTDGQYAELMAGSYSDNQPNFSWLDAYETKCFSEYWYPVSKIGSPNFANLDAAFRLDREEEKMYVQSTKTFGNVKITLYDGEKTYFETYCTLTPDKCLDFDVGNIPEGAAAEIKDGDGQIIAFYTFRKHDKFKCPETIPDMPEAATMDSAEQLYLAGVHVNQYRDPVVSPDVYWRKALERDINHIPSLIELARFEYLHMNYENALEYAEKAVKNLSLFNTRHKSGEAYYVYAQILEASGRYKEAYDFYYKSAWCADSVSKAMTRISMLDIRNSDYEKAYEHASHALKYGTDNRDAMFVIVTAAKKLGKDADGFVNESLKSDPLDHLMRFAAKNKDFCDILDSDPFRTSLVLLETLDSCGLYGDAVTLLCEIEKHKKDSMAAMLYYLRAYFKNLCGKEFDDDLELAKNAKTGHFYPSLAIERSALEFAVKNKNSAHAKMLLGCLLYGKKHYSDAASLWEQCGDVISLRNLAVAYFSHLGRKDGALALMKKACETDKDSAQLKYETAVLMDMLTTAPEIKAEFLENHPFDRDDYFVELSKAYNQMFRPEKALEVLQSRRFIPCEGGEYAIADEYIFAHLVLGKQKLDNGDCKGALEMFRAGQTFPKTLGAGIWNHCKLIPLRYHEALCLEKLGNRSKANEIFEYIANTEVEYFSNINLKELPYFKAKSLMHLGNTLAANKIITKYRREWEKTDKVTDNGYFCTTPFFISFVDDAKRQRRAQHLYLNSLILDLTGEPVKAKEFLAESCKLKNENLTALFFEKYGFVK